MALKECKECGEKVSTKADKCPNCGVSDPTTSTLTKVLSVIVVFVFIGWFCSSFGGDIGDNSSTNSTSWKDNPDKIGAHTMIEGFVEDRLKSPSTAEFPSSWEGYSYEDNIDYEGDQTYYIRSYVDSENSFGGTVRTNFTGRIKQVSQNEWQLIELNLNK